MFRILGAAFMLLGTVIFGAALYKERTSLVLLSGGEQTQGVVTAVREAGRESLPRSAPNLPSSGPRDVAAFELSYRFETPAGAAEGSSRLTFFEMSRLLPDFHAFALQAPVGQPVRVDYLASDPSVNAIAKPLSWSGFWYWLLGGAMFLALGAVWAFGRRR